MEPLIPTCPVTGQVPAGDFFVLDRVPTQEGALPPTRAEAMNMPPGQIRYAIDEATGHVWNRAFNFDLLDFSSGYDINLSHSPAYRAYLDDEAAGLVERHALHGGGKTVLEIGCGKGEFLTRLTSLAGCRGIGFDPTYVGEPKAGSVTFVKSLFTEEAAAGVGPVDAVIVRSVLQYQMRPGDFVSMLRGLLKPGGVLYVEVPNGGHTFERGVVWNVAYEHPNWYTSASLRHTIARRGYRVDRLEPAYADDQNLLLEAVAVEAEGDTEANEDLMSYVEQTHRFADLHAAAIAEWSARLDGRYANGDTIALWGCGARGIHLLTQCDPLASRVQHVVDINPNRQGRFVPLTGHQIKAPYHLKLDRPDVVIVSNAAYIAEILADLAAIRIEPRETAAIESPALEPA
jgi:SAM-dependent methyltransferase